MTVVWIICGCLLAVPVGFCLLLTVSALLVPRNRFYTHHSAYYRWLLETATAWAMHLLHIRRHVTGTEQLPEGRFLLVCNHRSNFDPIVTWHILRGRQLAFVSKEQNFHIPLFGRLIRKCCFMAIDRENPRKAMETIRGAAELIERDEVSVAVYPEGTRSKEAVLLPFHNGVFKIAQKAGVPIVVAYIDGTEQIHKRTPWRATDVFFDIIGVLPTEFVTEHRSAEIGDTVREMMERAEQTAKQRKAG